jgi:hypothetical protein
MIPLFKKRAGNLRNARWASSLFFEKSVISFKTLYLYKRHSFRIREVRIVLNQNRRREIAENRLREQIYENLNFKEILIDKLKYKLKIIEYKMRHYNKMGENV